MIIKDDVEISDLMHEGKSIDLVKVNGETVYMRDATVLEVKFTDTATADDLWWTKINEEAENAEDFVTRMPLGLKTMPESRIVNVRIPANRPLAGYFYGNDAIKSIKIKKLATADLNFGMMFMLCNNIDEFSFASFNAPNVTSVNGMLSSPILRKLDIHDLVLPNITDISLGAGALEEINMEGSYFAKVTAIDGFFYGCKLSDVILSGEHFPNVETCDSLVAYSTIKSLKVFGTPKLKSISRLCENCELLENVSIETSPKIEFIRPFTNCPNLKTLEIKGAQSVDFLEFHKNDDSFLKKCSKLEKITCSQSLKNIFHNLDENPNLYNLLPPQMMPGGSGQWVING